MHLTQPSNIVALKVPPHLHGQAMVATDNATSSMPPDESAPGSVKAAGTGHEPPKSATGELQEKKDGKTATQAKSTGKAFTAARKGLIAAKKSGRGPEAVYPYYRNNKVGPVCKGTIDRTDGHLLVTLRGNSASFQEKISEFKAQDLEEEKGKQRILALDYQMWLRCDLSRSLKRQLDAYGRAQPSWNKERRNAVVQAVMVSDDKARVSFVSNLLV